MNNCKQENLLEKDLYPIVYEYLMEKFEIAYGGTAEDNPISLNLFNSKIYPDIFGLITDKNKKTLVMAEGKRTLNGREFDICKGQAISLQRFSDYVYIFFPTTSWVLLTDEERKECISQCEEINLGLLIVDPIKKDCKELCPPNTNQAILKEENKKYAIKAIVDLFPDFSSDIHRQYCIDSHIGNNILANGLDLLSKVTKSKAYPVNENSVFYFQADIKHYDNDHYLLLNYMPFGLGIMFGEDQGENNDKFDSFLFKPTLALMLDVISIKYPYTKIKPILESYIEKSNHDLIIVIQVGNQIINGMKVNGEIEELELDGDIGGFTIEDPIDSICIMVDIPIFSREINQIKQDIDSTCLELESLIDKLN